MPRATCSRCQRPVSVMARDLQTGLCPRCQADDERASQAATLDGLRQLEDSVFGLLASAMPAGHRPAALRFLSNPRYPGLDESGRWTCPHGADLSAHVWGGEMARPYGGQRGHGVAAGGLVDRLDRAARRDRIRGYFRSVRSRRHPLEARDQLRCLVADRRLFWHRHLGLSALRMKGAGLGRFGIEPGIQRSPADRRAEGRTDGLIFFGFLCTFLS